MIAQARELLRSYPAELRTWCRRSAAPAAARASSSSITGPDLAVLGRYRPAGSDEARQASPLAVDADISLVYGKPELRVEIDRQRAADLGVRVQDIAQALSILVGGTNVTTFDVGDDQYNVTLRASRAVPHDRRGLERMTVRRPRAARSASATS